MSIQNQIVTVVYSIRGIIYCIVCGSKSEADLIADDGSIYIKTLQHE